VSYPDAFLESVAKKYNQQSVRLTTLSLNNGVSALTLRLDEICWPGYEVACEQG
jgi:hypothetical protein